MPSSAARRRLLLQLLQLHALLLAPQHAHTAAIGTRPSARAWQCLSRDRQPSVCFSTTATLAATPLSTNASTPDECCSACLPEQQCYCWTYSTADPEAGQD